MAPSDPKTPARSTPRGQEANVRSQRRRWITVIPATGAPARASRTRRTVKSLVGRGSLSGGK